MFLRHAGLCATIALAANAILIPPSVAIADLDDPEALKGLLVPNNEAVEVPCPGCPFAVKNGREGDLMWAMDVQNSLLVNVRMDRTRGDSLFINDVQLYPPQFDRLAVPMSVHQVHSGAEATENGVSRQDFSNLLTVTGYEFQFDSAQTIAENGVELLPMNFRINSVEGRRVNAPSLRINVLKDPMGRLYIASTDIVANAPVYTNPLRVDEKECDDWPLLCKVQGMVADKLEAIKSKMGKHCHKFRPHHRPGHHASRPHHPRPHHGGRPEEMAGQNRPHQHPHHHHMHHHSRLSHIIHAIVLTVVIPVLFGMIIGVCMYAIGFLVGSIIAFVLVKVFGRGRRGYVVLEADEEEASAKEKEANELDVDKDNHEAPPVYQEVSEKEVQN